MVGSANMDLVVSCDQFPQPGETRFGDSFATYPGGKGANQAVAAARLGGEVIFLGKIGKDSFGDELAARMMENGVQVDTLLRDGSTPTGVALITVDASGQNEILVVSGCNMKLEPEDVAKNRHLLDQASVLLLQLETPLSTVQKAAELAAEDGVLVVLNPAPAMALPDDLVRLVDYLTPNELEIETLSGAPVQDLRSAEEAARRLLDRGVGNVVVTLGASGAMLVSPNGVQLVRAPQVIAVDSTAAGDAFNGSFALALSWGWDARQALELAVFAASFSVTQVGAQPSLATLSDLSKCIDPELFSQIPRNS
ncbi:MAG: ribokinase [Rhodothermales bacterium]